jgi:hypothetical protein
MLAVLVVAAVIMGSVLVMTNKQPVDNSRIELEWAGLYDGDQFVYSVEGTFNDTPINGTINAKFMFPSSFQYNATFDDPEFSFIFTNNSMFSIFGQGTQVGTGMYATPFGVKGVVWTFAAGSWATVTYVGPRPGIAYGSAINGPNVHLSIALTHTTSQWTMVNNTLPLTLQPKPFPTGAFNEGGMGGIDAQGGSSGDMIYTENGAHMNYSIDAKDVDVISYSDGNIRSMAEGGPFAYDPNLYRLHSGNATGELEIPRGFFFMAFIGHNPTTEPSSGKFSWKLTPY